MSKSNKSMTINDLAIMIQDEFTGVNKRLDRMENDISAIKKEIASINFHLNNLEARVADYPDLRFEVAEMQKEVKRIKSHVGMK